MLKDCVDGQTGRVNYKRFARVLASDNPDQALLAVDDDDDDDGDGDGDDGDEYDDEAEEGDGDDDGDGDGAGTLDD